MKFNNFLTAKTAKLAQQVGRWRKIHAAQRFPGHLVAVIQQNAVDG
jgi:hypothetical protein